MRHKLVRGAQSKGRMGEIYEKCHCEERSKPVLSLPKEAQSKESFILNHFKQTPTVPASTGESEFILSEAEGSDKRRETVFPQLPSHGCQ